MIFEVKSEKLKVNIEITGCNKGRWSNLQKIKSFKLNNYQLQLDLN